MQSAWYNVDNNENSFYGHGLIFYLMLSCPRWKYVLQWLVSFPCDWGQDKTLKMLTVKKLLVYLWQIVCLLTLMFLSTLGSIIGSSFRVWIKFKSFWTCWIWASWCQTWSLGPLCWFEPMLSDLVSGSIVLVW